MNSRFYLCNYGVMLFAASLGLVWDAQTANAQEEPVPPPAVEPAATDDEASQETAEDTLSDVERARALETLRRDFLENEQALAEASVAAFKKAILADAARGLSEQEEFTWLVRWVNQTQMLPQASPLELAFVLTFLDFAQQQAQGELREQVPPAVAKVLAVVKDHIPHLSDQPTELETTVKLSLMIRAAMKVADERQRVEISQAVADRLDDEQTAARLLDETVGIYTRGMITTLEPPAHQAILAAWMRGSDEWTGFGPGRLAELYVDFTPPRHEEAAAARQQILDRVLGDFDQFVALAYNVANDHPEAFDEQLAEGVEQQFMAAVQGEQAISAQTLGQVAAVLMRGEGAQGGREVLFRGMADLIDRGGRIDGDFDEFRQLGQTLAEHGGEGRLRELLVREDGGVRLGMAKLLAWVYSGQEKVQEYRKFLATHAEQPDLTGDQTAQWWMGRAYAAQVLPAELSPVTGMKWMEKAFAAAESEPLRLSALEWMVERWMQVHEYQRAASLLASTAHQFSQDASRERIAVLRDQVDESIEHERQRQTRIAQHRETSRLQGQLETMQRRLEAMKEQGRSAEDVQSVQQLVISLEQQLETAQSSSNANEQ